MVCAPCGSAPTFVNKIIPFTSEYFAIISVYFHCVSTDNERNENGSRFFLAFYEVRVILHKVIKNKIPLEVRCRLMSVKLYRSYR